jgi:4,5-DOPA dioxygenase extradiol
MSFPSLFVSHGAPTLPFEDCPARDFLRGLGQQLGRPRAIVVASAHWDTAAPETGGAAVNSTVHDFQGFPKALYDLRYPAPGDPVLAEEVAAMTGGTVDPRHGLDHGAWVPLLLMYPAADIPVVQLSVQSAFGAAHHIALGRTLARLRDDNVLVMGSGGFVHNLRLLSRASLTDGKEPAWSSEFASWMDDKLMARDAAALADYRKLAPHAVTAQPTEDHFMPLFVAYGAGGGKTTRLHSSVTYGSLRMDAYAFG